jgi:hypothetical protein
MIKRKKCLKEKTIFLRVPYGNNIKFKKIKKMFFKIQNDSRPFKKN